MADTPTTAAASTPATDALAQAAIAAIKPGMLVGLGTGRTAKRGIRALAERVSHDRLDIKCVATSERSFELGKELGLEVIDFHRIERVDYLFDGADEVDRGLRILRGSGGAMTRERIVAWASDHTAYMVDHAKVVTHLGQNHPLAVAVLAFGFASVRAQLRDMGYNGVVRRDAEGKTFVTDNGNLILDVTLEGGEDIEQLAADLNALPGVIDHGLFLHEADEILIDNKGVIERLIRPDED